MSKIKLDADHLVPKSPLWIENPRKNSSSSSSSSSEDEKEVDGEIDAKFPLNPDLLDGVDDVNTIVTTPKTIHEFIREDNEDFLVDELKVEPCGLGFLTSECLQRFANKRSFMLVFSLLAIIQGMSWAYFTATITTLEKRFKISSKTAGIVMTGNEISQILFSLVISYYGSHGHRPRWIAVGILFSALSCFVLASPHFFYGPGDDAISLTEEFGKYETARELKELRTNLNLGTTMSTMMDESMRNLAAGKSAHGRNSKKNLVQLCDRSQNKTMTDNCSVGEASVVPLVLIFISQFVAGIGVLLFFSLGGPYLDDNIEKTKSPMLFGVTMCLRLLGPIMGFLLASLCLKTFISPTLTPIIKTDDPRWMGAWWLGWVFLGTIMGFTSFFIAMFPRELPESIERKKLALKNRRAQRDEFRAKDRSLLAIENPTDLARMGSQILVSKNQVKQLPSPAEMMLTLKSLLKNKINLYNNISSIFYLFSAIGYWTYMPKYMETIFMQTAVSASAISGTVSIAFQAAGLLLSGFLISKYQPSARKLAGWNVFLGILLVVVKFSFTQLGCNPGNIAYGSVITTDSSSQSWNLTAVCNSDCNCKVNKMLPFCHKETKSVFYSACHAGCTRFENGTGYDCSCLPQGSDTVTSCTCSEGCFKVFIIFLAINAVIKFLDSSGRIGNMLVSYRCVDPKYKSFAIGLGIFLISIFAMLPAPILFGYIFDKSCLVWGTKCGQKGNCWLYEGKTLRYAFNLTAALFTMIGAFFDFLVWRNVKDLDLYDEDANVERRSKKATKATA